MPAKRPLSPYPDATWAEALRHEGLARTVAMRFLDRGLGLDDLTQEGLIGVCRALETYDPARGKFSNYAAGWIASHLQQAIYAGQLVRYPARAAKRSRREGATPLDFDIEQEGDGDGPDDPAALVAGLLAPLAPLPRRVLEARYGLDGAPPRNLSRLAAALGTTRQRLARIEGAALASLRAAPAPAP